MKSSGLHKLTGLALAAIIAGGLLAPAAFAQDAAPPAAPAAAEATAAPAAPEAAPVAVAEASGPAAAPRPAATPPGCWSRPSWSC